MSYLSLHFLCLAYLAHSLVRPIKNYANLKQNKSCCVPFQSPIRSLFNKLTVCSRGTDICLNLQLRKAPTLQSWTLTNIYSKILVPIYLFYDPVANDFCLVEKKIFIVTALPPSGTLVICVTISVILFQNSIFQRPYILWSLVSSFAPSLSSCGCLIPESMDL